MITTKQRAALRSLANREEALDQIGKNGITENLLQTLSDALEARELIKITVLKNSGLTAREACEEIVSKTGSEPVQCIGNRLVIYKKSRKHQKILLD